MKIEKVATTRNFLDWPSNDLVYEWEDVFSDSLKVSLYYIKEGIYNKFVKRIPFINKVLPSNQNIFIYEMIPATHHHLWNKKNVLPCIIDFYLTKNILNKFYSSYKNNPVVFISSKEAYLFLKENNCPLNIMHLPLSISDKYKITSETRFDKKYDLLMMGRQNPILEDFTYKYAEKHKDFLYVYRKLVNKQFLYYTSKGECIGDINTRERYMQLMQQSRCGLYSTPGIDGGEKRTNGFNQVTPRFLELVVSGCHVIARYKTNADTDFYQLNEFSPSVETYEEFENLMDNARSNDVDMGKYAAYLSKHYTSERVESLQTLINKL